MKWLLGLCLSACTLFNGSAHADELDFVCGGWEGEGVASLSEDSSVVARIVFVGFPDEPTRQALPSWADTLKIDFIDYMESMSHGEQALDLRIIKPLDDSTKAWVADSSAAEYNGDWQTLNRQIMNKIHDAYFTATGDSIWKGVEEVCIFHYTRVWFDVGIGGYAIPGFGGGVPALQAIGFAIRFPQQTVNGSPNRTWSSFATGHEYGHNLGFWTHTPNTDDPDSLYYVNMGRYDCMRQNGGNNVSLQGFLPYHPKILALFSWLDIVEVTSDVLDLHVPDIRDVSEGVVYRVRPDTGQHFLLVNHQGTGFDTKYFGTGLLVWHILPDLAWDLECAGGKFTSGTPDPESGKDVLESSAWNMGSSADFFTGDTLFTCDTNPHTYLYQSTYISPQDVPTPIALENVRDVGSDMVVDVYLTPKQRVGAPNGGETYAAGDSMTVEWIVRPKACISTVDVDLSTNGGSSYSSLATGLSNSGSYRFVPTVVGTQNRVRVVSHDETSTDGVDVSDANFTLAIVSQATVSHDSLQVPVDSILVNIKWNTIIETQSSADSVLFYRSQTGGSPIAASFAEYTTSQGGLSHTAACVITPCDPGYWYYEVKSVNNGVTHWSARTSTTKFKVNACVTE